MLFDGIVGHDGALASLRRALAADRLPPSLLFHGPEGVGKRLAAFSLAAALNCPESPGEGCGDCASCRRTLKGYDEAKIKTADGVRAPGHHADVLFYPPRRRQILIEQVQDLCREAAFRPFEGRRRVFLLDPADRMNREAANALLKTLEEPPSSACLILLTASPEALLPTIRSRCQAVRFRPLPVDELAAILERRGIEAKRAGRLARLAEGSVGRALGIDLEAHDALRERLLAVLEAGPGAGLGGALTLAASTGDAAAFEALVSLLASLLRDAALLQAGGGAQSLRHPDLGDRLSALATHRARSAPAALERIEEGLRRVSGNVNPRLATEALLLDLLR